MGEKTRRLLFVFATQVTEISTMQSGEQVRRVEFANATALLTYVLHSADLDGKRAETGFTATKSRHTCAGLSKKELIFITWA